MCSPADTVPFHLPVRVYWEDTDAGGVVFYANYLKFFERARTEWLRASGVGQQQLADDSGAIFVVAETQVRYLSPARLDDLLRITVQTQSITRAVMKLTQQAWCNDRLLCEGEILIACVDRGTFRPRRIPISIFDRLTP
jgi:acyl-CoA thioester hydrolase